VADNQKLLAIYLNDHLAGATAGLSVAKRTRDANRGGDLGAFLERLAAEIAEDKRALEGVMHTLGIQRSGVKMGAAALAERIGRLKLNGRIRSYSPLSRVLELEGLTMGIHAKRSLWQNLRDATDVAEQVPVSLDDLVERAERQLAELERFRAEAARLAFR
jgi:hypothetical protein